MDKSQLMKGILEGCILKIIERRETYGYEIVTQLQESGFLDAGEGTLYPLLLRLEKKELITAVYKPSPLGPSRKYYTLTGQGIDYLSDFHTEWQKVCTSVSRIFEEENYESTAQYVSCKRKWLADSRNSAPDCSGRDSGNEPILE